MLVSKFTSIAFCFLLAFALCSGKHTLHVDDVLSSATNTVLLREVDSEMFTVDDLDLNFIDLNLQGETNFIMDTQGPLSFDGSFIGFNSPNYVNIVGEREGRLDTTGSASLSGDSLEIDALRFIINSGGDLFMNTDGSIITDAHRVGISSLTHSEVAVASGPLELLAGGDLEMTATHVELIGDDRISLYSSNSLDMTTVNDFQSYSAFIDFDSYGDIKLSSQTGNIHVDTIRDIIFEAEDIELSAPIGIELQSEHGEIFIDAADTFLGSSKDIILMETNDEARFIASNEFNINTVDLSLTTSELIKFHAKTLEIVFSDAVFQSHTTEIITGGDINFLLNSAQGTSYFMGAKNGIEFESRNIVGTSSSDLSFYSDNSGDISLLASSVFDSTFLLNTNELDINSVGESKITAPVVRLSGDVFTANGNDIDIRADSSIGDRFTADAASDIILTANSKISNSIAEDGIWHSAIENLFFSSGDIFLQAGELVDERFIVDNGGNSRVEFLSDRLINVGVDGKFIAQGDDLVIETLTPGDSFLMAAYGFIQIDIDDLRFNADDQVLFELEELYWETYGSFIISAVSTSHFFGAEINFWINEEGRFEATNGGYQFNAEETIHFQAFTDLSMDDFSSITADLVLFEATENVDIIVSGSQNYITSGVLEFASGGLYGITYEGNSVSATAKTEISFDGGFIVMDASDDLDINASVFNIITEYEEDIRFVALDDFRWSLDSGNNFVDSADDIIFNTNSDILFSSTANSNLMIKQGYENYVEDNFNAIVNGESAILNSMLGNIHINSASDIEFSSFSSSFDFTRSFKVDVEGDSDAIFKNDILFTSTNEFSIFQNPGPTSVDDISFSGNQEIITLSGDFVQNYGSTTISSGSTYTQTSSEGSILLDSGLSSYFTINNQVSMDASGSDGNIWLKASNDYHGSSSVQSTTLNGDIINFKSELAENIQSTSNNGDITITSGSSQPITWNAVETFNITALSGFDAKSNNMIDGIGIWLASKDTIMSEININSRNDNIEFISLDSQIFSASVVSLNAGSDFTFTNFYPPLEVGGVSFKTQGSSHDGIYEDESGISVRSHYESANINFDVLNGSSNINAGYDIENIVSDGIAFFNADENITFDALNGDILINAKQGDVIMQSNIASVTFNTNSNSELQSYDSIETLAGKAISLISTDEIISDDNNLSFDFSALEGNIITSAVVKQPILFEGNDFDLYSNEEMQFIASDDLPFLSISGGINVNSDTGIYLKVDGGDIDITASDEIFLSSSENHDTRIESGNDMNYNAISSTIEFTSGIDSDIKTQTGDILFKTADSLGDILIFSEHEIRFQADGTDDNIGASQVDGIFVDAPQIQAFSTDDILFDAYSLFTIGANTRPVISFEAGGSSTGHGVSFTAEGNINQVIGENFIISTNGAMLWNSNDLDVVASGAISIVSKGSLLDGKDIIFKSDQKSSLNADDISLSASEIFALYSEKLINVDSSSLIDIDIAGSLETSVREKYDINAADWEWNADSFTLDTRGDVIISNGGNGGITVYGDSNLSFNSDVIIEFFTFSESSPLSISSVGGNSIISISTNSISSPILFEIVGDFTATSISESSFSTDGEIQITSPLNSLYSNINSAIDIISAGDLFFNAESNVKLEAAHGLNITAASDMNLSVDAGSMNIFVWEDAYFISKTESLSIRSDYNITFVSEKYQNGDISLSSTRDIEITVAEDSLYVFDGDFITTAGESYELIVENLDIFSFDENSIILFSSENGPVEIDIVDMITINGGDIYLSSSKDVASITTGDNFDLSTSGIHNNIVFSADAGILSFTTTNLVLTSIFDFNSPGSTSETPSQRNGNGFIDFSSSGVNPTDGYAIRFETSENIDFDIEHGFLNFWSSEQLSFDVSGNGIINSESTRSDTSMIISALTPGGSAYFESEIGNLEFNIDGHLTIDGDETVEFLPFDNLFISANQPSASNEQSDILLKVTHPAADLNIFTTDFLTGDVIFQFGGDVETYSEKETIFLLLDDDDTAEVGTYLVDAGGSISMGAENDFIISETGPGDIQINDPNGQLFFSAGNDLAVVAREVLEFSLGTLEVVSEREFILSGDDISIDVQSLTMRGEGVLSIIGDNHDFFGSSSLVISTSDTDPDLSSSDVNQEIFMNAIVDIEFTSDTVNINVPPHRVIDFRDGLLIPRVSLGTTTGSGCAFADRSLYYDTTSNRICYCNTGTAACLSTIPLNVEVP